MLKSGKFRILSLGILFMLFACSTVSAASQGRDSEKSESNRKENRWSDSGQKSFQGQLIQANKFIGMELRNKQDKELGSIEEVLLDNDQSRARFALVSKGGVMGWADENVIVPISRIEVRQRNNQHYAVLDKSMREWENDAPTISLEEDIDSEIMSQKDNVNEYYDVQKDESDYYYEDEVTHRRGQYSQDVPWPKDHKVKYRRNRGAIPDSDSMSRNRRYEDEDYEQDSKDDNWDSRTDSRSKNKEWNKDKSRDDEWTSSEESGRERMQRNRRQW